MHDRRSAVHTTVLIGAALLLAARFWFVCDDAYITFRYAKNWATGQGLVFNPGEFPPVEGYSDFLWLILAFFLEGLGIRPDRVLPVVSAGCAVLLTLRVYTVAMTRLEVGRVAAFLGALVLAASPAMGCWATSGLETMPQALLTFLLFERVVLGRKDREWVVPAALALALALIRTEGIAWVAVVFGMSIVARIVEREKLRPHLIRLGAAIVPTLVIYAFYTAWRFQYYGTFVPNTALVKVAFGFPILVRGLKYVALFWATCLVPLAMFAAIPVVLRSDRQGAWVAVIGMALVFPTYGVVVGGDFMPFGRLLIPGLPFVALLIAGGLQELIRRSRGVDLRARWVGASLVFVGLLPAFDLHLVPHAIREQLHFRLSDKEYLSELNRWQNQRENSDGFTRRGIGLAQVAEPTDAVVAAAVGAVGYWSGIQVHDQHGLITKEIAYRQLDSGPLTQSPGHDKHVEPEFFVKYEPRFLFARAVEGKLAAGRMKDSLDQWHVQESVMDRYVPDYYEVTIPGYTVRTFLFVVRRRLPDENPEKVWNDFPTRRRALNAELRAEYSEDPDEDPVGSAG